MLTNFKHPGWSRTIPIEQDYFYLLKNNFLKSIFVPVIIDEKDPNFPCPDSSFAFGFRAKHYTQVYT
jgi:hypothetical protein